MKLEKVFCAICSVFFINIAHAAWNDYIKSVSNYLGLSTNEEIVEFSHKIPYEVSAADEKFISEASKLTGVALSELDSCQHRVVLKLKADCHKMNDEQVAKMGVHLLNCQSYIEGRQIYPCNEEMSLKDCTAKMDSDTWTAYHIMTNRARAVCYMIRQTQFRGLAENTVNRLMDAAQNQLSSLGKIAENQENIKKIAENTFESLIKGHEVLNEQQKDIQRVQFQGQLAIEDNIERLVTEKRIIAETHNELLGLARNLQKKLEESSHHLKIQSDEAKINHGELINDLVLIQKQTQDVLKRMEISSKLLMQQNEDVKHQYHDALKNLAEVNRTVHDLVVLVGGTRQVLEERLAWVTNALGGTDLAVERIYLVLWHFGFLMAAMLCCAFMNARSSTRLIAACLPPLNLSIALYNGPEHLGPLALAGVIIGFALVQLILIYIHEYRREGKLPLPKNNTPAVEVAAESSDNSNHSHSSSERYDSFDFSRETSHFRLNAVEAEDYGNLTPPMSRLGNNNSRSRSNTPKLFSGGIKSPCGAKTRMGTPCKLSALAGRDYCYRHQSGDSVMG